MRRERARRTMGSVMSTVWRVVRSPWVVVVAQVLALEVVVLVGSYFASRDQPLRRPLDAFAYGLLIVAPLALAASRRWPLGAFALALTSALLYYGFGYSSGPITVAVMATLYMAVVQDRPWR